MISPFISSATFCFIFTQLVPFAASTSNFKRGLVYSSATDAKVYTIPSSLTWYYDYTSDANGVIGSALPFVPMVFNTVSMSSGVSDILSKLPSSGLSYILAFNEPDGTPQTGGTNISPQEAAENYVKYLNPIRDPSSSSFNSNVRLGWPATTGSQGGYSWLKSFNASCHTFSDSGCIADFLPTHWYGSFESLASWAGQLYATWPDLPLWMTEFGLPGDSLEDTEQFLNQTLTFLDGWDYVQRYCYFGAYQVGEGAGDLGQNGAMIAQDGTLTSIGTMYLGNVTNAEVSNVEGAAGMPSAGLRLLGAAFCVSSVIILLGW